MKKVIATVVVVLIAVLTVVFVTVKSQPVEANNEYLRIHVRANSNSAEDQKVKYEIKDEAVKFITPYIKECVTKEAAMEVMGGLIPQIEEVCTKALEARGYTYGARAEVRQEKFPTRVYGELTLEEGVYDALIIELGTGTGDNWWCVIYPPLCFTAANADVEYRSVIMDIINKFFGKKN
ncbi:MAG: stage II sporulation protein R [Clostridia bacterium]|nr:stage II sporulation protein R [Clostridia bacterium]